MSPKLKPKKLSAVQTLSLEEQLIGDKCPACHESDIADNMMVQCDRCDQWFHFTCAGVDEGIKDTSFVCVICVYRSTPASTHSGRSEKSRISMRIQIDLQRLEEEKAIKQKLLEDKSELNKEFVGKKYELLHAELIDVEDNISERSHRSNRSITSKVQQWLQTQEKSTMSTGIGKAKNPTGLTANTGTIPKRTAAVNNGVNTKPFTSSPHNAQSNHASGDANKQYGTLNQQLVPYGNHKQSLYSSPQQPTSVSMLTNQQISPLTEQQKKSAVSKDVVISPNEKTIVKQLEKQVQDLQQQLNQLQSPSQVQPILSRTESRHLAPPLPQAGSVNSKFPYGAGYLQPRPHVAFPSLGPNMSMGNPVGNSTPVTIPQRQHSFAPTNQANSNTSLLVHPDNKGSTFSTLTSVPCYTESISSPLASHTHAISPSVHICEPNAQQLAARHVVPKDLPIFFGDPVDWPLFYSSYLHSTQMCGYSEAENLMRLQRCLKGNALEAVRSCLLHPSFVTQIITTLQTLYGRPELIVKCLLDKVRSTPPPRADKLESLINFGLVVQNLCGHLRSMGMDAYLSNPILLQELVDKLPTVNKLNWAVHQQQVRSVDVGVFGDYMASLVSAVCQITPYNETVSKQEKPKNKERGFLNTHSAENELSKCDFERNESNAEKFIDSPKPCPVCKKDGHKVKDCRNFKESSLDNRWKLVEQLYLCRRCLVAHGKWPCKAPVCGKDGCGVRHNSLLHPGKPDMSAIIGEHSKGPETVSVHHQLPRSTLFRVIPVTLYGKKGKFETLAFLDDGSSLTLVEKHIANQLGIEGEAEPLCLQWTSNVKRMEKESKLISLEISASNGNQRHVLNNVRTVESLELPRQSLQFDELAGRFPYIRDLPVQSFKEGAPGILIGLDNARLIVTLKKREGHLNEPVAAKTRLGWTIFGSIQDVRAQETPQNTNLHICARSRDQELHDAVNEFFNVENLGVTGIPMIEAEDDQRARKILQETTKRLGTGRFETGLLWKCDYIEFPHSRSMAERRLKCLERRLERQPDLYANVKQQINDYRNNGYAHIVTKEELANSDPRTVWYLPLGIVLNPNKPGKVRVVWDAAAKVDGISLNSMLLKGPDLLASLPTVLYGFRQRQIAITGDIKEMFHQIVIRPQDRQAQRFLWRDDSTQPIQEYVMDVATFGSTCSPCSAHYVKNRNAEEWKDVYPQAAMAIIDNHYVDDYLDSVDTEEEAIRLALEVKTVHAKGGFHIRNWLSNSDAVIKQIGDCGSEASKCFTLDKTTGAERVLGMIWLPNEDVFTFAVKFRDDIQPLLDDSRKPTKREVLRVIMSIFDPLGFVAPFVVHGKCLIQDIWRSKVGWDEKVPDEIFSRWKKWVQVLGRLCEVKIPRCYFPGYSADSLDTLELHVFVDASESAYASVAYFRIVDCGRVRCALVASKTKVAPLKPMTIPRLELQAAVLGARMAKTIQDSHKIPIRLRVMWSDSSTVLSWIRSDTRRYPKFVAFRVSEILNVTSLDEWRWLPTRLNVADEATKWGTGPSFRKENRWFRAPEFLNGYEVEWPANNLPPPGTTEELRPVVVHHRQAFEPPMDYKRFSKWERLLRSAAFVYRFIENSRKMSQGKNSINTGILSQEELQKAEACLWRWVQMEAYSEELAAIERNQQQNPGGIVKPGYASKLDGVSAFVDQNGILRMEGRIGVATCAPYSAKFPAFLPKKHPVTELLVDFYHRRYGHGSGETVVNEIKQHFKIARLRPVVRKIAKQCTWCAVYKATPAVPRMAPLPESRVTPYVRPFTFTGVDYCGPFIIRIGRSNVKRWVMLLTCLTVRAVHLEIACSLSTESCKMALRRFIARRGSPQQIYSDQGTNFQGARKELKEELASINRDLAGTFTNCTTQWYFNPPAAPHMGGAWERLVRSVKTALFNLAPVRKPDEETFGTLLAEVEGIVNSRPLTYVPLDAADNEALTPNHFLMLSSSGVVQPLKAPMDSSAILRSNWNQIQALLDQFWNRWIKEYLPNINQHTKWLTDTKPLQPGDLVIIVDDRTRNSWTRGKVVKVIPGRDGRVRRAEVITSSGVVERPVSRLAVLDVLRGSVAEESILQHGSGNVRDDCHLSSIRLDYGPAISLPLAAEPSNGE
ncbi:uncharacterized protein LOC131675845 [Topomyia yanbarensis]|uniref:uncharacterized protein LOC131675845 n=1 Tax=Topomyia yanbarensis TaxID=2498891 RepID=UPI00273CA057|nr:uncharacterized protein LOC131675845 [Topomyia yanbarensis]